MNRHGMDRGALDRGALDHGALGRGTMWLLAGLAALGFAYWLEHVRGMAPCALCLWERLPYRCLIAAGAVWIALGTFGRAGRAMWGVVALILVVAAGMGVLHLGVEQHWWPSPLPECAAPHFHGGGSFVERLAAMPARPAKPCDAANALVQGAGVSVVDAALFYAVALIVLLLVTGPGGRAGTGAPARTTGF